MGDHRADCKASFGALKADRRTDSGDVRIDGGTSADGFMYSGRTSAGDLNVEKKNKLWRQGLQRDKLGGM